ncbi:hypothetical protein [Streptomyces sp. NPDC088789]|uniref:hypothetical protein n=1 Tax=Streptomyces sp. NPDC088789 TaxID=3365899 RepID=UPI00382B39EF
MPTPRLPHASRRLLALIRGALVTALVLCSVLHGLPDEHGTPATPPPVAGSAPLASDGQPHHPHAPHGADTCAADLVVRTTEQSAEERTPGEPDAPGPRATAARALVPPLPRRDAPGRRGTRTGRAALARTSRWRI